MTIGLIARCDNSGLGSMSWELAKHIKFDQIKLQSNGRYQTYPDRFYNVVDDLTTDIVIGIETMYGYQKKPNQKLVLIPMYECSYKSEVAKADKVIAVSLLDKQYYPEAEFIPWPINTELIKYKHHTKAKVFVHNAGHGGLGGRNGTKELIEAMQYVKAEISLIIRSQVPIESKDSRIEVIVKDYENYWDIWGTGDVFVFPEKFNGLSLPIQEAIGSGMAVMCTNRFPFNAYLPREIMIEPSGFKEELIAVPFQSAVIDPVSIAKKIDEWAYQDISGISREMGILTSKMSWEKLADRWKAALCN